MNLSQEQLKEIQKYAMLQFTAKEIAILLELDQKELVETIKDETSEPFKYFQKGRLSVEEIAAQCQIIHCFSDVRSKRRKK